MAQTAIFTITGMHCSSCEQLIKEEITELPGIKTVDVSYTKGIAAVTFDSKKTTNESIVDAIKTAGYDVIVPPGQPIPINIDIENNRPIKISLEIKVHANNQPSLVQRKSPSIPAESPNHRERVNLALSGMHCSSCAGLIERSLKKSRRR